MLGLHAENVLAPQVLAFVAIDLVPLSSEDVIVH